MPQQVFANLRRGLLFIQAQHWRLDLFDDEMAQMLAQTGVVFNHFDGGPDGRCGDGGIATGTMGRDVGVHADRESQAGMAGQGDGAIKQFGQGFQAEELTVLLEDVPVDVAGTANGVGAEAEATQLGMDQTGVDGMCCWTQPGLIGGHGRPCCCCW